MSSHSHSPTPQTPYRQIRALYDEETITVYQAYSSAIADPAVKQQRLSASPAFSHTRMTWIKPSWAWMMYRCGYSFKDKGQERVLAIRMTHEGFRQLLGQAVVCCGQVLSVSFFFGFLTHRYPFFSFIFGGFGVLCGLLRHGFRLLI